MFYISFGLGKIHGVASFRIAWGLQIVPGLILAFGCLFIPESPRWLAKQERWGQAEYIVAQIQAKGNTEDPEVLIEIAEIKEQLVIEESAKSVSYATLFQKKVLFKNNYCFVFPNLATIDRYECVDVLHCLHF